MQGSRRRLTTPHKLQGRGEVGKPFPVGKVVSAFSKPTAAPCQLHAVVRQRKVPLPTVLA